MAARMRPCHVLAITMGETMLENSEILEHRIRERAFQLWQEAGCPEGRAEEFWHLAREKETAEPEPPAGDTQNFA